MKLSTKARYAVKAMLQLALNEGKGRVTLAQLTTDQNISLSYLEQLFARLRDRGMVVGVRGPGGGYRLARPAHEISVAEIVTSVDSKAYVPTQRNTLSSYDRERSQYHDMWVDLSHQLYAFLDEISLADLVAETEAPAAGGMALSGNSKAANGASRAA